MDTQKIDMFMMTNAKNFPEEMLPFIRQKLEALDDSHAAGVMYLQFKDPTLSLILSILVGEFGVDRFYLDDILLGVCKLLTAGGCGVWWLIDIFLIQNATRRKNFERFMQATQLY